MPKPPAVNSRRPPPTAFFKARMGWDQADCGPPSTWRFMPTCLRVSDAYLEWRWDPHNPAWAWDPMIRRTGNPSATDVGRLAYHGYRLFKIHHASRGRGPDDPRIVCEAFKERLPHAIRAARDRLELDGESRNRDLRQHELAAALGIDVKTLRVRLNKDNC